MMPDLDGFEFLKRVRPAPDDSYDVIVVTGYANEENVRRCYELGAALILRKPFIIAELRHLVRHFVDRRAMESRLREANKLLSESRESLSITLDSINDASGLRVAKAST
jgi:DNA-binding response OmpR family regulator